MTISSSPPNFDPLKPRPESKPDPDFSQPDSDSSLNPSLDLLHLAFNPTTHASPPPPPPASAPSPATPSSPPPRHAAPSNSSRCSPTPTSSPSSSAGPTPTPRIVGEIKFCSEIVSVKLRHDMVVVVLLNKVFLYGLENTKPVDSLMTLDNPKGLCEVSQKPSGAVLACPGLHEGQVRVNRYRPERSKFISTHSSDLMCFALTLDGEFLILKMVHCSMR